jgi:hypothetical protein
VPADPTVNELVDKKVSVEKADGLHPQPSPARAIGDSGRAADRGEVLVIAGDIAAHQVTDLGRNGIGSGSDGQQLRDRLAADNGRPEDVAIEVADGALRYVCGTPK